MKLRGSFCGMMDFDHLVTAQLPGRILDLAGEEYLFFSGTAYLGIPRNKQFQECLIEGISRYGTNYSSSRNANLQLRIFEETETYLATFTGAQAALTLSSGSLAGQALAKVLVNTGRALFAPGTHPALWQQPTGAPTSQDYEQWVAWLLHAASGFPDEHLILVCNSVDPLKARKYDFAWLQALPKNKQITLVVDDSHGFGIIGEDGAGIYKELQALAAPIRVVVVASFGKAFGIPAGVILGDKEVVAQVRGSAFFGGASPAIPAYLYAFLQAGTIFQEARQTLSTHIHAFRQQLIHPDQFRLFDNYPVFYTPHAPLAGYLFENKVVISSFRYPTPADALMTRIILSSLHQPADISRLADLVNKYAF